MVRTEEQRDLDVDDWVASQHAGVQRTAHTLFNCRDVFAWNGTALDRVDELEALARLLRLDLQNHVTVLTTTTRLLDELAFGLFAGLADRFAVGNLWLADGRFDAEFALHAVNDNFQVQLAHTTDDGLARLFVGLDAERRIFLCQAVQRQAHFFLVGLGLRLDCLLKSPAQGRPSFPA